MQQPIKTQRDRPRLGDWVQIQRPRTCYGWRGIVMGFDRASGAVAIAVLIRPRNCSKWGFSLVDFAIDDVAVLHSVSV